jgi:hypothetical protein
MRRAPSITITITPQNKNMVTAIYLPPAFARDLDCLPARRYGLFPASVTRGVLRLVPCGTVWKGRVKRRATAVGPRVWRVSCSLLKKGGGDPGLYYELRHAGEGAAAVVFVQGGAVLKLSFVDDDDGLIK